MPRRHRPLLATAALLVLLAASPALGVRETKFYDVLGIAPDADDRTIKKAYKKAALKWHPDRHADAEDKAKKAAEDKFKEIAHAYETLSDSEKRSVYDKFGEAGLKQGGGGGPGGPGGGFQFNGDPFMMFNTFFGGGGGGSQQFNFGGGGGGGAGFQFGGGGGGGAPRRRRVHRGPGAGGMGGGGGGMGGGGGGGGGGSLYEDDANVLEPDESEFPASANGWVWLVEFYAPWCGHCQQLTPKWKKVAASLKGVVKVAAVNCEQHKSLCAQQGVRGYPTIKALGPTATSWSEYPGERSASALASWAQGLIGNAATAIAKDADLTALLAKCGGSSSKDKAAWSTCLLLVSDKTAMPMLWKALSVAYKGKVAFGFIGAGAAPSVLAKVVPAGAAPVNGSRVITMCNGDLRTAEPFTGKTKSDTLQRHISAYAAGKKCLSQIVLDATTDLTKLKVPQLKALIASRGLDCSGCFEKADYIGALRASLSSDAEKSKDEL